VSLHLGRSAIDGPWTAAVAAVALAVLGKYRVNSAWLVLAGGVLGWVAGPGAAPR
jgi:chromate transporter